MNKWIKWSMISIFLRVWWQLFLFRMNEWMNEWMKGWMKGWINAWMSEWLNELLDGYSEEWEVNFDKFAGNITGFIQHHLR